MKSTLIILASIIVLWGGYAAYIKFIPAPAPVVGNGDQAGQTPLPTPSPDKQNPMQSGLGSWGNLYDKDGHLTTRFRAADYRRLPDGSYHLSHPEAEFYQPDQQVIHLTAVTGDIIVQQDAQRLEMNGATPSMPREGTLQDVRIDVFPNKTAYQSRPHSPDLTITMPNMHFDSDSFQVLTIPYRDASGRMISADEVPVTVRGNVEMDGQGLVLYWNDETHQLKTLTIAHGHRMLIKDADAQPAREQSKSQNVPQKTEAGQSQTTLQPALPADRTAISDANPSKTTDKQKTVFEATFNKDVVVNQNGMDRVWADQMFVDFLMGSSEKTESPPPPPAQNPAPPPAKTQAKSSGMPTPNSAPSSPPTSAGHGPIIITWNGPLNIIPAPDPAPQLAGGQRIVRFVGSPARIHDSGPNGAMDAASAVISYNSADGYARMKGTPDEPTTLYQRRPDGKLSASVIGQMLLFSNAADSRLAHQAILNGPGHALFPDPSDSTMLLRAAWDESCHVNIAAAVAPSDQGDLRNADLRGNAQILQGNDLSQPRLNLQGDDILINFQTHPSAVLKKGKKQTSTDVQSIIITGNAHCVIHEPKTDDRTIDTDKLTITTAYGPAGKIYPQYIKAAGDVIASQGIENLHSDKLDAMLAPAPPGTKKQSAADSDQGQFLLERLLATGNVVAHGKNNSTLVGDELQVEQVAGQRFITVLGQPPALIDDGAAALRGNEVDVRTLDDWAQVPGPGTIDAAQTSKGGQIEPMHIVWDQNAELRGRENLAIIRGNVVATQTDEKGALNTGKGDRMILTLGPKPPATRPSKKKRVDAASADQEQFMQNKQIDEVSLLDHAEVSSVLLSPDGKLLRRAHIFGQRIDYYTQKKKMIVPVPGRMLVEDYTGKPDDQGATAFQWQQNFTFDQLAQIATFDSPVTIVHKGASADAHPVRLIADHVVAHFQPAAPVKTHTASADDSTLASAPLKLKDVTARGNVQIFSQGSDGQTEIDCSEADYDAASNLLICRGQEGVPVTVTNSQNGGGGTFGEVWFNATTGQIVRMFDFTGHNR
ncbi:MAG TPA: LPS export ABC transporter periplasmic protein LptC [Tepidisphaeraceae bacterium]|nr:LPS export ABC transporter periplasmic protein LptC [Tepidisphaeraceae bacterium]